MAINCAAIPETLLESELFGYERGAFTGAVKLTRRAHSSWPTAAPCSWTRSATAAQPAGQAAALPPGARHRAARRPPRDRRRRPLGLRDPSRPAPSLIAAGSFREDLYYRLSEIALHLPPLREREGESPLLARHFLARYGSTAAQPLKGFTSAALHALDVHPWPGNVRELQNRVKRAVVMADGSRVGPRDLDLPDIGELPRDLDLRQCRDAVEQSVLRRALARCNGNLASTARLIGVTRPTLYDLLRHHGLRSRPERP